MRNGAAPGTDARPHSKAATSSPQWRSNHKAPRQPSRSGTVCRCQKACQRQRQTPATNSAHVDRCESKRHSGGSEPNVNKTKTTNSKHPITRQGLGPTSTSEEHASVAGAAVEAQQTVNKCLGKRHGGEGGKGWSLKNKPANQRHTS